MPPPEAAVAIVEARNPEPSILLIRRTEREDDPWSGHWSFPGGRCEPEDRDALDTALRELEEECGVRLAREVLTAGLPCKIARRRVGPFLKVAPFHFRVEQQLGTSLAPQEAVQALWVPVATLLDPARHLLRAVPGLPQDLLYPAINLSGPPLWGFTYRLITQWLGLDPRQPNAGKAAAHTVLDFLLASGLELRQDWSPSGGNGMPTECAQVAGPIPVDAVLARFCAPGRHVAAINRLQVRRDFIQLAGPDFEEYRISAQ